MRIELIATGNELLDGSISDRHSQKLAHFLNGFGMRLSQSIQIPDIPERLEQEFLSARQRSDVVVVTGGLGPTSDDITLECAAKAFGKKLKLDQKAKSIVEARLRKSQGLLNEGNRKQMYIPEGSKALANPLGTAPSVLWRFPDCVFYFVPGVPREFEYAFENWIQKDLRKSLRSQLASHLIILKVFGWRESELDALIKSLKVPQSIEVGFRTHLPENHIKLRVPASSRKLAEKKIAPLVKRLRKALGLSLFTTADESFEQVVVKELLKKKKTLALAESCTGGLTSSLITRVSGSSQVFDRAFITYSNEAKIELLGVNSKTLKKYGAVSEETAMEMSEGALSHSHADVAVGITGVAGPTGGTRTKPVGLVWVSARSNRKHLIKKLSLPFDREQNQMFSAYWALQLVRQLL